MVRLTPLVALLCLNAACMNWIGVQEAQVGFNCLDMDQDGATAAACPEDGAPRDCNDTSAAESPGAVEVPYDGLDNDCSLLQNASQPDTVDVDGDGFPGIGRQQWDELGSRHPWPASVFSDRVDCDDTRADVHPNANDQPYDGVDQDCDGADDFDHDGDGYASAAHADAYDGPLPATDCNDSRPDVHPGAVDTWYDGLDQDCDGSSDHDRDRDGFDIDVDCDDLDPAVNPAAIEVWYDGVDGNCDGADDFDQDGDGAPLALDCVDTDAGIFVGALEFIGDGIDQDCDGGDDTTPHTDGGWALTTGAAPVWVDDGHHLVLAIAVETGRDPDNTDVSNKGLSLVFERSGQTSAPSSDHIWLYNSPGPLDAGLAAVATPQGYAVAYSYERVVGEPKQWLLATQLDNNGAGYTSNAPLYTSAVGDESHVSLSLAIDDAGELWALACGDGALQWVAGSPASGRVAQGWHSAPVGGLCLLEAGSSAVAHTASFSALLQDGSAVDNAPDWDLTDVVAVIGHQDAAVFTLADGGVLLFDGVSWVTVDFGEPVVRADAVWAADRVLAVAVTSDGRALFAHDSTGSWSVSQLAEQASHVAVGRSDDRVSVALTTDGSLQWAVMGLR